MTPQDKADRAEALLADPLFEAVLHDLRMRLVVQLEACPMGDVETQHEVALTLQLLRQIKPKLQQYIDDVQIENARAKQDTFMSRMRESARALVRP